MVCMTVLHQFCEGTYYICQLNIQVPFPHPPLIFPYPFVSGGNAFYEIQLKTLLLPLFLRYPIIIIASTTTVIINLVWEVDKVFEQSVVITFIWFIL